MKAILGMLLSLFISGGHYISAQWQKEGAMRIDLVFAGDKELTEVSLAKIYREKYWGGTYSKLIDHSYYGSYRFEVFDQSGSVLLYSRNFDNMFGEWQTTAEATSRRRAFEQTLVFPFPSAPVNLKIYKRYGIDSLEQIGSFPLDPADIQIRYRAPQDYHVKEMLVNGPSHNKLDLVFLSEGYTTAGEQQFYKDVSRFLNFLFTLEPFAKLKSNMNIRAVFIPSKDEGPDVPGEGIWKDTPLDCNFYTFGSDRYLTTESYWKVRDAASEVPYDQILICVNTETYGGGGIFNHYSVFSSRSDMSKEVFIHEFGHAFGGLGDEYYDSDVAYSDFYKLSEEPNVPNLTTLVQFERKWKDMLPVGLPVPTPPDHANQSKTGVYEGGGYSSRGIYRPETDCRMKSNTAPDFCSVCRKAMEEMINFYCDPE